MKKLYFLFLMCFAITGFTQKFGLKGGLNIGKEKASESGISITSDASPSFLAGIYSEFSISEEVSVAPELIYSVDGGKFNIFGFSGTDRLSYLSVPLLLKFNAHERFSLLAGPQIGFLLKAESEANGVKEDFTSEVKGTNFSFDFGAELNTSAFNLGFRYVLGLTNLNDLPDESAEIKLNTIQIYLAIPLNNI